jgi:hypothetical protein
MNIHIPTYRIGLLMPFNDFFAQSQTALFGNRVINDLHDLIETRDISIRTRRINPFRWNADSGKYILERVNTCDTLIIDITKNDPTLFYAFGIISVVAQIQQIDKNIILVQNEEVANNSHFPMCLEAYKKEVINFRFDNGSLDILSADKYCEMLDGIVEDMLNIHEDYE